MTRNSLKELQFVRVMSPNTSTLSFTLCATDNDKDSGKLAAACALLLANEGNGGVPAGTAYSAEPLSVWSILER